MKEPSFGAAMNPLAHLAADFLTPPPHVANGSALCPSCRGIGAHVDGCTATPAGGVPAPSPAALERDDVRIELTDCWCAWCDNEKRLRASNNGDWYGSLRNRMNICPDCGNKRCPKSTAHWQDCTASNEPGQVGSWYGVDGPSPLTQLRPSLQRGQAEALAKFEATS